MLHSNQESNQLKGSGLSHRSLNSLLGMSRHSDTRTLQDQSVAARKIELQAAKGAEMVDEVQEGFTGQQLIVLRAQILAFKRLKVGCLFCWCIHCLHLKEPCSWIALEVQTEAHGSWASVMIVRWLNVSIAFKATAAKACCQ